MENHRLLAAASLRLRRWPGRPLLVPGLHLASFGSVVHEGRLFVIEPLSQVRFDGGVFPSLDTFGLNLPGLDLNLPFGRFRWAARGDRRWLGSSDVRGRRRSFGVASEGQQQS